MGHYFLDTQYVQELSWLQYVTVCPGTSDQIYILYVQEVVTLQKKY